MNLSKIILSTLGGATLALTLSACNDAAGGNSAASNAAANKSNTATIANSNPTATRNATPAANSNKTPAPKSDKSASLDATAATSEFQGKLQVGKTESLILYVGKESGDYAAYCFANDSEVGKAILAACKNGEQCKIVGESDGAMQCVVPGLEANLSDSGNIIKITSVKSLSGKK